MPLSLSDSCLVPWHIYFVLSFALINDVPSGIEIVLIFLLENISHDALKVDLKTLLQVHFQLKLLKP